MHGFATAQGMVADQDKLPLPAVSLVVKGTQQNGCEQ
jgi:hypothetical protein